MSRLVAAAATAAALLAAESASAAAPVVFWSSEAQPPGSTVMAMGGGLAGATVQLTDASGGALAPPRVLGSWDGSVKFALPAAGATAAFRFRACTGKTACSGWRTVNAPDIMWAVGDASANATAVTTQGGWLKLYGRSLGFTAVSYTHLTLPTIPLV